MKEKEYRITKQILEVLKGKKQILAVLRGKIDGYYLAGGTALSSYYFNHRESFDLDFFSKPKEFSKEKIQQILDILKRDLKVKIELTDEKNEKGLVRMMVYIVELNGQWKCKLDFVEDYLALNKPLNNFDGIPVISLEDIYLRKIITVIGHIKTEDIIGRDLMIGGRQEAKDFYDLYFLSTKLIPLSEFVSDKSPVIKEGLINWCRSFNRDSMRFGVLDLIAQDPVDFRVIEGHFREEIDKLLLEELGEI